MWTTRSRTWERVLVAECEAFLSGHSAQYFDQHNRPVPAWAWLNLLAHGTDDEIAALASGGPQPALPASETTAVWFQAVSLLGQELMIQATRRGRSLAELQRWTLVPLELELAGPRAPSSVKPAALVTSVLSALVEHPTIRWQ
jgi:hypothetical protein